MTAKNLFLNPEPDGSAVSQRQLETLLELQTDILSSMVSSDHFDALLTQLCLYAEKLIDQALASVMIFDEARQGLFVRAAPSIPDKAIEDLDGLSVGVGSCGNAVQHNEAMYVCDIEGDHRWDECREFARKYQLNSCWSHPIRDASDRAIGSFALTGFSVRQPDNFQRRLLDCCASIASIILQREAACLAHRERERQLRQSHEEFSVTVDSIADGVISTDENGEIVIFNRVAERLTGWSCEAAIGSDIDQVLDVESDYPGEFESFTARCILGSTEQFFIEENIRITARNGDCHYVFMSLAPLLGDSEKVKGIVVTFHDISEQRNHKKQLVASQNRLRSIIENSADVLLLHREDGTLIDVNQAACDSLGYDRDELLGMNVCDIEKHFSAEDMVRTFHAFGTDKTITSTGIHQRKDGSQFPVEVQVRKFLAGNEYQLVAFARDITNRKRNEEELIKVKKLESIGLLAGGIAHDFNNLLSIIIGNIDLAKHHARGDERIGKYLQKAGNASNRAADLTQQLLTFSRGGEPVRKSADIVQVIRESTEFSLHGASIQVEYDCPDHPLAGNIDTGQISQVIQNLVINARQAMPSGGTLRIGCREECVDVAHFPDSLAPGRYIRVSVSDTGPGIDASSRDSIFDPYFTTKSDGSGLGLALSYSIIRKHGGVIFVDGDYTQGASFVFYVPSGSGEDATQGDPARPARAAGGDSAARIMIMDDDAMIREIGQEMLEDLGFQVVLAEHGEAACLLYRQAMADNRPIDLVVMDLTVINGMGGKEAIERLKAIDPGVRAIVSSGYSSDDVMANYEKYGFSGAVSKPYSQHELAAAINHLLAAG